MTLVTDRTATRRWTARDVAPGLPMVVRGMRR
jgi:hypothetical protein